MSLTAKDLEQIRDLIVEPVTKLIDEKLTNIKRCYDDTNIRVDKLENRPDNNRVKWQSWTATMTSVVAVIITIFRWNK